MPRFLLSSHDGYGMGHTRRNSLIAQALVAHDPAALVTVITGLDQPPAWLRDPRVRTIRVPSIVKDETGRYRGRRMSLRDALARRAATFAETVSDWRPDVVVVDRHPFGTFGELRRGLLRARLRGAAIVLGLRDVLDEPDSVGSELDRGSWTGVREIFTDVLVYGAPVVCDHQVEYGLPVTPTYCGWVTPQVPVAEPDRHLLVVAAGGGADGRAVYALGAALLGEREHWRATILSGPLSADAAPELRGGDRIEYVNSAPDPLAYLARAAATVQMAGYNSTVESLALGLRPILMPRRSPRREQAIRALRLASLGLADVVDSDSTAPEVAWLLDRPRRLLPGAVKRAGIDLDGAQRVAERLGALSLEAAAA